MSAVIHQPGRCSGSNVDLSDLQQDEHSDEVAAEHPEDIATAQLDCEGLHSGCAAAGTCDRGGTDRHVRAPDVPERLTMRDQRVSEPCHPDDVARRLSCVAEHAMQFPHRRSQHFIGGWRAGPRMLDKRMAIHEFAVIQCEYLQDAEMLGREGVGALAAGDASEPRLNDPVAEPIPCLEVFGIHGRSTPPSPTSGDRS